MNAILDVDARNLTLRAQPGAITSGSTRRRRSTACSIRPIPARCGSARSAATSPRTPAACAGSNTASRATTSWALEVVLAERRDRPVRQPMRQGRRRLLAEGSRSSARRARSASSPRCCSSWCRGRRRAGRCWRSYDRIEDAAETVSAIVAAHIIPCTLEFLDRMTAVCVEDYAHVGLPTDCEAVLLMETDGHPAAVADEGDADGGVRARATAPATCARRKTRPRRCSWRRHAATRFRRWPAAGRPRSSRTSPCRAASSRRWCASSPTRRASSTCRSAPSATWATATFIRRS